MHVVLLSSDLKPSIFELSVALEREASVSQVDLSDDPRSAAGADIVIIDDASTAEAVSSRLRSAPGLLMVVAKPSSPPHRVRLLDGGADVVLHGPVSEDEIVAQVRALARRRVALVRPSAPPRRRRAKVVLGDDRRHVTVLGRRVGLTLVEGKLLAAFMTRPGEVLDTEALLTSAWGSPFGARSTVSASIRRLRVKIEPDPDRPVFIRTVWGGGYAWWPDGES